MIDDVLDRFLCHAEDGLLYIRAEGLGMDFLAIKRQIKVEACRGGFSSTLNGELKSHIFQ